MRGSTLAVVDGWNIDWNLPDGRIVDIPIDPATNLSLFQNCVCTSEEYKSFESKFMNNVCMPCKEIPGPFDQ